MDKSSAGPRPALAGLLRATTSEDLTGAALPGGANWCYGSFEQTNLNEATIYNMGLFNMHFASADLSNSTSTSRR